MMNFLRELIPTQTQLEYGGIVAVVGSVISAVLGLDSLLKLLLVLMTIDYITGVLAAYINPEYSLNSQTGFKGILKKVVILCVVSVAHFIDGATGQEAIRTVVIWFFAGNEGLSIVENAAKAGIPIPSKLRDTLEQLATEKDGGLHGRS